MRAYGQKCIHFFSLFSSWTNHSFLRSGCRLIIRSHLLFLNKKGRGYWKIIQLVEFYCHWSKFLNLFLPPFRKKKYIKLTITQRPSYTKNKVEIYDTSLKGQTKMNYFFFYITFMKNDKRKTKLGIIIHDAVSVYNSVFFHYIVW